MKSYLFRYYDNDLGYSLFEFDHPLRVNFAKVNLADGTEIAIDVAPEIISAAIYRLLEELKEKKIEGYDKAFGEET